MEKLRVLQVNKLYYPVTGGIERTLQYIAEGLNEVTDMKVLVCQKRGRGCHEKVAGVSVYRSSSAGVLFSLPISISFIRDFRYLSKDRDIVHIHVPFPLGDLACLLSGYKGKVIVYWHSDIVKQKKLMLLYKPVMRRFLKRADVIVVGAEGVLNGSSYLAPFADKCVVIPFAVSRETEARGRQYLLGKDDEESALNKRPLNFLFVGRLVYYKGVDVLIEAFEELKEGKLTIVGTGELEEGLKTYVRQKNMESRVRFLSNVNDEDLQKEFEACDVFVLPSVAKSEAFGLVQIEAMSYGKPVINTNLPSGVPDVSINGKTGLTVEPHDSKSLKNAMQWMTEHPKERLDMGIEARKRMEKEYTMEAMLNRIMLLYSDLADEHKKPVLEGKVIRRK